MRKFKAWNYGTNKQLKEFSKQYSNSLLISYIWVI